MLKQDKGFGSGLKGISCMKQKKWQNKKVLILPLAALGDLTIYIRIAWNFYTEGAKVTLKSNLLNTAKEKFPWLIIELEDGKEEFKYYSECYDLVIACYEKYYKESLLEYTNVAFVTAKKIKSTSLAYQRSVMVDDQEYQRASRALCLDTSKGLTMVDWADEYTHSVYDIKPKEKQPLIVSESRVKNRVLIFPLSPQPKKNYYLRGFIKLADKLSKLGWDVEFICSPSEYLELEQPLLKYKLKTFKDIGLLLDHISNSEVVISNDSGGGHFASLCDLKTFTITRRGKKFSWRPGFNEKNTVVSPLFKFKILGRYIWRPLISIKVIISKLGEYQ